METVECREQDSTMETPVSREEAFYCMYEQYKDIVYKVALQYTGSEYWLEDIKQEVFLRLWKHWTKLIDYEHFPQYVYATIKRVSFSLLWQQECIISGGCLERMEEFFVVKNEAEGKMMTKIYEAIYAKAIEELPRRRKKVYRLRAAGYNHRFVANMLNVSTSNVKTLDQLARRSITTVMSQRLNIELPKKLTHEWGRLNNR